MSLAEDADTTVATGIGLQDIHCWMKLTSVLSYLGDPRSLLPCSHQV